MRYRFAGFELDDRQLTLTGPSGLVHVEPQVFEVLLHLLRHCDRVVSQQELYEAVWGGRFVSASALTSRVKAARRSVGDDGESQRVIRTVHGRGYQLATTGEVLETETAASRSAPATTPADGPNRFNQPISFCTASDGV